MKRRLDAKWDQDSPFPKRRCGSWQDAAPFFIIFLVASLSLHKAANEDNNKQMPSFADSFMTIFLLILLVTSFCLTLYLTFLIRKMALRHNLLDIPNHRSAHKTPTPRGGGLAIVNSFFVGVFGLYYSDHLSSNQFITLLGSGFLISLAGFLDDRFSISPIKRLVIQFLAAGWGLFWLAGFPDIQLASLSIENILLLNLIGVFYLVWLTNLYNFMDGINGIASLQAISVTLGMALIIYWTSSQIDYLLLLICFATCGFLYWNFPKAKIFMGDVGSGFLGLILGLISIIHAHENPLLFFSFLILMAVFILDATLTLFRRLIYRKRIYEAHSSHAYQNAARQYRSHTRVSMGIFLINSLWLLPIALGVATEVLQPFTGLVIAYIPLIIVGLKLKAGLDLNIQ